ncbi:MAG: DUF4386 family protein [Proteobacteria bacterium]|uniref:hypothetical protein n=1 Tax=Rudaea sp. TaxID=2136325 RepID=UPI00321FADF9|nr:DUF4386 family protein [Pseudomonadota bacterium]
MISGKDLSESVARFLEPKTLGRLLGLSMLLEFVFELISNFAWQARLFDGSGLLARAATMQGLLGSAAMVDLISGGVDIALGVAVMLRYRAQQPVSTRVYLGLLVAILAASMTEDTMLLAMGRLGAELQRVGTPEILGGYPMEHLLRALRAGIHLPVKLLGGFALTMFFILLGRVGALPRALAIAGIVAAGFQMIAIGMDIYGLPLQYILLAPLALVYPVTGLWLVWRGLNR